MKSSGSTKRILIIDDDVDIRKLLEKKLYQQGYRVDTVNSAEEGLEKLKNSWPDMVMVDVTMPGMDGFEFCHKALELRSGYLPIMVMTAQDDDESVHRAYDGGATDFITKPINQAKLLHRIRFALKASDTAARLADRETLLLSAQRTAGMGEWTYDIQRDEFECSSEAARLFGLDSCHDYEQIISLIADNNRERVRDILTQPTTRDKGYSLEFSIKTRNGEEKRIRQTVDFEKEQVYRPRLLGVFQDVTSLREAESKAKTLSMYDSLTGLPNRSFFLRMLERTIASARRHHHRFALAKLNIDNFMRINANLGHETGDKVLGEISLRLEHSMRNSNMLSSEFSNFSSGEVILGHLGADKFALVFDEIDNYDVATDLVNKLIEELNDNFIIDGNHIHLSTSIGIVIFPDDAATPQDLLMTASSALAHAKELGPNRHSYSFYSEELNRKSQEVLTIENHLVHALDKGELQLHYQPKISLVDNRITGAEALLRWNSAELGKVPPDTFIRIAENKGLIEPITEWVITEACQKLVEWQEEGLHLPSIAINLESSTLLRGDFNEKLFHLLKHADIDLSRLDFEITESTLMENLDIVLPVLKELRRLGSSISIDDFGTGYSSLGYLKTLPISKLKIDKSFIHELLANEDDAVIVNAVISLAHNLGMKVIAEGVEVAGQVNFLRERDCDIVQGYYYSKPLPATDFYQWCMEHNKLQESHVMREAVSAAGY